MKTFIFVLLASLLSVNTLLSQSPHGLEGMVVVKVEIDETGRVIDAKDMCQGPPYLSQSSVASALQARFTPTKLSGKPVKVKGVIQYRFVRQ